MNRHKGELVGARAPKSARAADGIIEFCQFLRERERRYLMVFLFSAFVSSIALLRTWYTAVYKIEKLPTEQQQNLFDFSSTLTSSSEKKKSL